MKSPSKNNVAYEILGITLVCMVIQSCSTANKIYSENDVVYSKKRFELEYYVTDRNRRSPVMYFKQSIIKEITPDNEISYTAYDVLTLSGSSFSLDEKVFLIVDNEVISMIIDKIEFENVKSVSENTENLLTSDSTTVSVITGYSERNVKRGRFSYKIPDETISKIRKADQLLLRYYSGPSMMTIKPKKKSIRKLKQLIDIA